MKAITEVLNQIADTIIRHPDQAGTFGPIAEAIAELDALKEAGVSVTRKETYAVSGPARKRGRKSK